MSAIFARSSISLRATSRPLVQRTTSRGLATEAEAAPSGSTSDTTHFKITLRRSAISLGDKKKGTLKALGLHRRFQTVYHRHNPESAGKILAIKELLEVENVPADRVLTKQEMRQERKAPRGYQVVSSRKGSFLNV
ncbi:ribosomal protein L30 [Coprinopsis sp. MPI-PUGE-AT-0042]|nr:ribosomal protein L30 [Coprinopsis sp. MPI-PUGE-AT-0042]